MSALVSSRTLGNRTPSSARGSPTSSSDSSGGERVSDRAEPPALSASPPPAIDVRSPANNNNNKSSSANSARGPAAAQCASPGPASPGPQPLSYLESLLVLTQGATFLKFASSPPWLGFLGSSKPVPRYVFFDKGDEPGSMGTIYWCKDGRRTKDASKSIPIRHITALYEQTESAAFQEHHRRTGGQMLSPSVRNLCFSIVTKDRTLDLQAPSIAVRNTWMHAIHQILVHSGYNVHEVDGGESGESPHPGGLKSPTSASIIARDEARKLAALHVASPMGSPAPSAGPSRMGSPATVPPTHGQMLSPPPNAAHLQHSPNQTGSKFTPANTPVLGSASGSPSNHALPAHAHARAMPDPQLHDDPLLVAKLQALSNDSVVLSPMMQSPVATSASPRPDASGVDVGAGVGAAEPDREIPAGLLVVGEGLSSAGLSALQPAVFSPSERPTQTPACSPAMAR